MKNENRKREHVRVSGEFSLQSRSLKWAIVLTGMTGIMAEYLLSTLATYLLGNPVAQWTIIISTMLLAMGIGSGVSVKIKGELVVLFITVELLLAFCIAVSAVVSYIAIPYPGLRALAVYCLAFIVGLLIGFEIPLAARINEEYEELRLNIAGLLKRDYIGAFFGGILFLYVALPYFGLAYLPLVLGTVSLFMAVILFLVFKDAVKKKGFFIAAMCGVGGVILFLFVYSKDILLYQEQKLYLDRIVYLEQTPYQRIVITKWRGDYWLYLNGNQQFSSYDEKRYHEPLVHPASFLSHRYERILVIGGGDGLAMREILKHKEVQSATLVDLDPAMTKLAENHPVLTRLNARSMQDKRVHIINGDGYRFLEERLTKPEREGFDVIYVDLPDPRSVELSRLYSVEFYHLCKANLRPGGILVTQSISPLFARKSFLCVLNTLEASGFSTLPYHASIPTMGDWGWIMAAPKEDYTPPLLKRTFLNRVTGETFNDYPLTFLDKETMKSLLAFGRDYFREREEVKENTLLNPVLPRYYDADRWDVY